jgi:hypothetical protein
MSRLSIAPTMSAYGTKQTYGCPPLRQQMTQSGHQPRSGSGRIEMGGSEQPTEMAFDGIVREVAGERYETPSVRVELKFEARLEISFVS